MPSALPTLGITDEHQALAASVAGWAERHCPPSVPRAALDAVIETTPDLHRSLCEQGWLGLAVSEARGGEGFGLSELAVVVEQLGNVCAPGPMLSTVMVAVALDQSTSSIADDLVPALVSGERTAAIVMTDALEGRAFGGGLVEISGSASPVLGVAADVCLVAIRRAGEDPAGGRWAVVELDDTCHIDELASTDPTRRVGRLVVDTPRTIPASDLVDLGTSIEWLAGLLVAAECVGIATWCTDTAATYAKVREQFGRPIGQFQAVKHRCADMLLVTERARAATWDAARATLDHDDAGARLAVMSAAGLAVDAAVSTATDCIQILGGIGFTWEHDAHLYLKRAMALSSLLCGSGPWFDEAATLALSGARRRLDVALPPEAESLRVGVAADADRLKAMARDVRRVAMVDEGYLVPHWPRPWGRSASALEQLVIDEEFGRVQVARPHLQVGAWVLPTLIAHGTPQQQERWVRPTLLGEIVWCQLFSEPGAGSDLASLTTKAVPGDGGWLLSGQKVWTTMAHEAQWGICLARTNPEAPKHQGISCFVVDMASDGIDVRPLRELTGAEMFNEVFLADVFVPDDCLIGEVDDGWRVGRTTLANERVSMGSGSSFGFGLEGLLRLVNDHRLGDDAFVRRQVGELAAAEHAQAALGFRMTLRSLSGAEPGSESSVRKLLGVEHDQRVQQVGMSLLGDQAAALEGDAAVWVGGFLANRCLSIAGGTSEVQRNVIAERMLGLPRDP